MKLLIIDDNPRMRLVIRRVVAGVAEQVFECGDGSEALAAFKQHRPDWVLMDIRMGGTNGITATRQIRADDPEARIVIVTDYDDFELREAAREAGACAYVVKENLLDLRRLLAENRGSRTTLNRRPYPPAPPRRVRGERDANGTRVPARRQEINNQVCGVQPRIQTAYRLRSALSITSRLWVDPPSQGEN